jgi:dihydroxy-acid dehydratase
MDVETDTNCRLANRRAMEAWERATRPPRRAVGSPGLQAGLPSGSIGVTAAGVLDVNLTGARYAERKTNWQRRATNHTSVVLTKCARRIGPAAEGVLAHPGRMYEKLRYVDV